MRLKDLVIELEAKIEKRWPAILQPFPPATVADLDLAERAVKADLTDEIVWLAERHNGCYGYPLRHYQTPLMTEGPFGDNYLRGGPFNSLHAFPILADGSADRLCAVLDGPHRGQIYRMSIDAHYLSGRAGFSLADVFEAWLFYIDNDYFVRRPNSGKGYLDFNWGLFGAEGQIEMLSSAYPQVNPLTLYPGYVDDAAQVREQTACGMEPWIDQEHPDHFLGFNDRPAELAAWKNLDYSPQSRGCQAP